MPFAYHWVDGKILLDPQHISRLILQDKRWEGSIRNPEGWSFLLNKSIKDSVLKMGTDHLKLGGSRGDWMATGVFLGLSSFFSINSESFLANFLGQFIATSLFANFHQIVIRGKDDYRFSLILGPYGPQLDRAFILQILGRSSTLVKSLPKQP
jgi:hypothetical protein